MELVFNRILKEEIPDILPLVQQLMGHSFLMRCSWKGLSEMFDQNYECFGILF